MYKTNSFRALSPQSNSENDQTTANSNVSFPVPPGMSEHSFKSVTHENPMKPEELEQVRLSLNPFLDCCVFSIADVLDQVGNCEVLGSGSFCRWRRFDSFDCCCCRYQVQHCQRCRYGIEKDYRVSLVFFLIKTFYFIYNYNLQLCRLEFPRNINADVFAVSWQPNSKSKTKYGKVTCHYENSTEIAYILVQSDRVWLCNTCLYTSGFWFFVWK